MSKSKIEKQVPNKELIIFLMSTFFFTNMQGMVGNYRQAYLVNVLKLESSSVSLINVLCSVTCFALSFFYTMVIDRAPKPGKSKFRPLVAVAAVPAAVLTVFMFVTPQMPKAMTIAYLVTVGVLHAAAMHFTGTINNIGVVMTQNNKERDKILSLRGIFNAIANSAPLVVVLVLKATKLINTEEFLYIISAALCAVVALVSMLFGVSIVRERVAYSSKKENPLLGFWDIVHNPYALLVLSSEFLKNFRCIASYMGIFLAAALLGDTSKYIFFGLPTGIGTFVGMMIVSALLKKFNSKQIYIASGCYSVLANTGAFFAGLNSFKHPDQAFSQVLFFVCLFLIGLQFGASNLLPSMFQADILEDLEVKTHKRLDASLAFVIGIGSTLSGIIGNAFAPMILYGNKSFIQYLPPVDEIVNGVKKAIYLDQPYDTKVRLLLVYTVFHGVMMLLAGLPFLFYRLTGKRKEEIHKAAIAYRESLTTPQELTVEEAN
ncbi:MAG: MFS transporter [Oscillospiraceae bacterium]|jgi:Na+/melibiose symporter-like transporter|nr:MFS transporter [Oscillospiraceae bacterium]